MKRHLLLIVALTGLCITSYGAGRHTELPDTLDGTMITYDFRAVEPPLIPDSLTPVHIDYVARHGARFLTSEGKVESCEKLLKKAQERAALTRKGNDFLRLLSEVRSHTDGRWGLLSPIGIDEEWRLGTEMAEAYAEAFRHPDAQVVSVASYVPRVVQTMDCFTTAIAYRYPGIDTRAASGRRYDRLTRFFVTDSLYNAWRHEGEWTKVYDRYAATHIPTAPAQRLVGDHSGLSDRDLRKLTYDMYMVLQGMRAASLPAPTTEWMSEDEYRACWEVTNLEKYFQYWISPLSDLPARGASDLLRHIFSNSVALASGNLPPGLTGVFGHAETLIPFFSLLGITNPPAGNTSALASATESTDYSTLSDRWSDVRLTPLGANLAIIYFRSSTGRLYAGMRLNGRNISPVADPAQLIVPLATLQAYWLSRLAAVNP